MRGTVMGVALLLGGCGNDDGVPSSDGGGDPQVQTFTCNAGAVTFPELDKSCTTASDCILVIHQTDCCGNAAAVAINASGGEAFWAAEAQCAALFPACGCAMGPLATEDGLMVATGAQLVDGVCVDNRCLSKATGTGAR